MEAYWIYECFKLFFDILVFNVNLFKVFCFKDINIFKNYNFCFNINLHSNNKIFPDKKNRKGLSLTKTSTGNDFSKV